MTSHRVLLLLTMANLAPSEPNTETRGPGMPALETLLADYCGQAGVTGFAREAIILHLADGMSARQIRLKLHKRVNVGDIQKALAVALSRLKELPGFWDAARQFPHHLVFCAADRRVYDERPADMRGVEPDWSTHSRYPAARVVTAGHPSLRQDLPSAAHLWAQSLAEAVG